jgi:hypothetical protein
MKKESWLSLSRSFDLSVQSVNYRIGDEKVTSLSFENINLKIQKVCAVTNCRSKTTAAQMMQEQIKIIQRTVRFFHKILLQAISPKNLTVLLENIGNYCTRVEHFIITGWKSESEESVKCIEGSRMINSVKTLVLKQFVFSPTQLHFIITYLPNLESLILKHCFFYKPFIEGTFFFVFPLLNRSLKYLKFDLDKTFSGITVEKAYYIKLGTDVGQKPKYCSFLVEYDGKNEITGYSLVENLTAAAFDESITDKKN